MINRSIAITHLIVSRAVSAMDDSAARPMPSCGVRSLCPSVRHVRIFFQTSNNFNFFTFFLLSGSQITLDFPYQTAWQYSNVGHGPQTGASNAGGLVE